MTFLTIKNMRLPRDVIESDPAIAETLAFFDALGAEIHEMGPGFRYCCFQMPFWNMNKIFVEQACTYEALTDFVEKVNAFGYPHSWIVAEHAYDEVVQEFLHAQGVRQTAILTSMVCDLTTSYTPCCLKYPLQAIEPMIALLKECFSFPESCAELFLEKIQAHKTSCPIHLFFGKHNGKIACSGLLFEGREQAGIFYLGTKKEARNQGLGHAMVQTLLHEAKELGKTRVVLTALGSARKLYEKSGFYPLEEYRGFSAYTAH